MASAPAAVTSGIDVIGAGNTTNTLTLDFGAFSPGDPFYQPNLSIRPAFLLRLTADR